MLCPGCGEPLEENMDVCPKCSANIDLPSDVAAEAVAEEVAAAEATAEPSKSNALSDLAAKVKKMPPKKLAMMAVAVVAVIFVLCIVKNVFFSNSSYSVAYFYDSEEDTTYVYVGKKNIGTIDGALEDAAKNMDRDAYLVVADDGTAYYIAKNKIHEIIDDCTTIEVAANAKKALLLDEDGTLYTYSAGKKAKKIAEDEEIISIVLSGDGKTYAYVTEDEDGNITSHIGKKTEVDDVRISAISENGKYIYGTEDGDLVLVSKKGKTEKISDNFSSIVGLNEDGTQIMFEADGKVYVSVKGGDRKKVAGGEASLYYDDSEKTYSNWCYPVKSFKNAIVVIAEDDEYYVAKLNGKYEAKEILNDISNAYVDADLKKMYYLDGDELCRITLKPGKKSKTIAKDVASVCGVSDDGKILYYLDEDGQLYYVKNGGTPKAVKKMDDVSSCYGTVIDGTFYARVAEDEDDYAYYAIKGKNAKEITDDENITMIRNSYAELVYAYDSEDGKLYTVSGNKLKEIKTKMESITSGGFIY